MSEAGGRYTTPLSSRQFIVLLVGAVAVLGLAFLLREFVYPWLGVPVVGVSGLAPFILAWALVLLILLPVRALRRHKVALLVVSIAAAVVFTILSMLALARYFAA